MPTITRTMIKTALVHALVGMVLSAIWVMAITWPIHPLLRMLQPTALHLIVVGWLTQLIFGIALWMFPPWSKEQPRGPEHLAWASYGLLNVGLCIRLVAEPFSSYQPALIWSLGLVVSAVAQVVAIWLFVVLAWRRVRGKPGGKA